MLKQKKDGSWAIENLKDLDAVADAIEEREAALKEIEEKMEEEFEYLSMKEEVVNLKETLRSFMDKNDHAQLIRPDYKIVLVKRTRTKWNESKLKKVLTKGQWLKITKQIVDPGKIDDLVRAGEIKEKEIASALEQTPEKPHLRWFYGSEDAGDKEAQELEKVMNG